MERTTIMLPAELRAKAKTYARARGLTFGELVRRALAETIAARDARDSVFAVPALPQGFLGPRDGSTACKGALADDGPSS